MRRLIRRTRSSLSSWASSTLDDMVDSPRVQTALVTVLVALLAAYVGAP